MRYRPELLVIAASAALVLAACAPRQVVQREPPACSDPLYLRLKAEPPDSLSDREWTRLQDLERACVSARAETRGSKDSGMMMGMRGRSWLTVTLLVASGAAMWLLMGWWR